MTDPNTYSNNSDRIKCPHCHETHTDLWEFDIDDGSYEDVHCDCGGKFRLHCSRTVAYVAQPLK